MRSKMAKGLSTESFRHMVEEGQTPYGYRLLACADLCPTTTTICDLGCGDSALTRLLGNKAQTVRGFDRAEFDFNTTLWPIPAEAFPVVVCADVLEHILDPRHFLAEVSRILRPYGTLILITPNIRYLPYLWSLLCGRFPRTSGDLTGYDGGHLHYFTYTDVDTLLHETGFTTTEAFNFTDWDVHCTQWRGRGRGFIQHHLTALLGRRLQREFFSSSVVVRATKWE